MCSFPYVGETVSTATHWKSLGLQTLTARFVAASPPNTSTTKMIFTNSLNLNLGLIPRKPASFHLIC